MQLCDLSFFPLDASQKFFHCSKKLGPGKEKYLKWQNLLGAQVCLHF